MRARPRRPLRQSREGLYASHHSQRRKQRDKGVLASGNQRRCLVNGVTGSSAKEHGRLKDKLQRAEMIIEVQKEIFAVYGISDQTEDEHR